MNWIILFRLSILLSVWMVCVCDRSQRTSPARNNGDILTSQKAREPGSIPRRVVFTKRQHPVVGNTKALTERKSPQGMLSDEAQTQAKRTNVQQGRRSPVSRPQLRMLKDDSVTAARSRMVRFPAGSSSPNILASFAGKNRVWIISAPHASDGYYRLMMSLMKNDVYCELAERHIQQIVIFHDEGEEGGKIRRITNEGKVVEQPLDPSIIPKMMNSLKLEKGKFGMVLLKKTLQVEERYPYPVRLEAMYEVVDQSPIRKIEKLRQKGFVQKCKAAGVEGQVTEDGDSSSSSSSSGGDRSVKPTQASETIQVSARKEEQKKNVQPTRFSKVKTTKRIPTPPPARRTTTLPPTTRIVTTPTRPPTTIPTTVLHTTQKIWTTRVYTTPEPHRIPTQAEVTTRETEAPSHYFPVRTDKHKNRHHVQTGRHFATTSRTNKESYTEAPVISTTITQLYTRENTGRFTDNHTDRKDTSSHDTTPSQRRPTKPKMPKKKADKILNNEYEDKLDSMKPTISQVEEGIEERNIPQKKGKDQKKEDKIEKKKKKNEKPEKPPKIDKQAKKEKQEKKSKPEKVRNKKNKKGGKNDNDGIIKPGKKTFEESPKRTLSTFLSDFEGKRRLLLITAPKEDNNMYSQQRDEYLEAVCEMAVRKISIITILGTMTNSTMKIDHFQLDNEKPMKVIGDDDLLDINLINELRKEYGMTYNDFFMVLTDLDMKVKQYYEVPIAMKSVFDIIDTFQSRIKEMEKQKREGITCKREDKARSLENFLSRFRWRRRLFIISAPSDEEWAYQQQLYALSGQACNMGLRHLAMLKMVGLGTEGSGVLELYPINGSSSVEREDLNANLVKDIRNYFQVSPEYFSMLLVGKDGNVKSWYPSPMWSLSIIYDLIDSMQLRRQEMAIQQSLGMRCPEDEYAGYGYHGYGHQGYEDGYQDDYRHHEGYHRYRK
ncbi:coiled-coil domain-containing protein 80 [Discoglossus pictus]